MRIRKSFCLPIDDKWTERRERRRSHSLVTRIWAHDVVCQDRILCPEGTLCSLAASGLDNCPMSPEPMAPTAFLLK